MRQEVNDGSLGGRQADENLGKDNAEAVRKYTGLGGRDRNQWNEVVCYRRVRR